MDYCDSKPCVHGVCNASVGGYRCSCNSGYYGDRCQYSTSRHYNFYIITIVGLLVPLVKNITVI